MEVAILDNGIIVRTETIVDDQYRPIETWVEAQPGWLPGGSVAAGVYTPPAAAPAPIDPDMVISDRQFFQELANRALISQAEALAAVKVGDLPVAMVGLVAQLPEADRFSAEMMLSGATEFRRSHPLTNLLGVMFGWDAGEIDQFWADAAAL